jgi:hypothetical protein
MMASASRERRQFRALVRLFAYRFFDTDILSVRGDLSSLLSQFAALLAAFSLILVLATAPKYAGLYQHLTPQQLHVAAWGDQEFLISTSMAIVGVFTLLLWDALFPDRRDCMILGAMPVRIPAVFVAKLAALGDWRMCSAKWPTCCIVPGRLTSVRSKAASRRRWASR